MLAPVLSLTARPAVTAGVEAGASDKAAGVVAAAPVVAGPPAAPAACARAKAGIESATAAALSAEIIRMESLPGSVVPRPRHLSDLCGLEWARLWPLSGYSTAVSAVRARREQPPERFEIAV